MKKDESLMGMFALIIGFFAFFTSFHVIGFLLAIPSLALAIPSLIQTKKRKICGVIGFILSLIVVIGWYIKRTGRLPI